jgi:hypothetical protein
MPVVTGCVSHTRQTVSSFDATIGRMHTKRWLIRLSSLAMCCGLAVSSAPTSVQAKAKAAPKSTTKKAVSKGRSTGRSAKTPQQLFDDEMCTNLRAKIAQFEARISNPNTAMGNEGRKLIEASRVYYNAVTHYLSLRAKGTNFVTGSLGADAELVSTHYLDVATALEAVPLDDHEREVAVMSQGNVDEINAAIRRIGEFLGQRCGIPPIS